jgi:hypothetical protein
MPDFDFDAYNHVYENTGAEHTDGGADDDTSHEEEPEVMPDAAEAEQNETTPKHDNDDDLKM